MAGAIVKTDSSASVLLHELKFASRARPRPLFSAS